MTLKHRLERLERKAGPPTVEPEPLDVHALAEDIQASIAKYANDEGPRGHTWRALAEALPELAKRGQA